MNRSHVFVSLQRENTLDCSYAIVQKEDHQVIIIVQETVCAIYDADALKEDGSANYLLLKHYPCANSAYRDFLKLIGKMCTKKPNSKYFGVHIHEDNRMVFTAPESEHMINADELPLYSQNLLDFRSHIALHHKDFFATE